MTGDGQPCFARRRAPRGGPAHLLVTDLETSSVVWGIPPPVAVPARRRRAAAGIAARRDRATGRHRRPTRPSSKPGRHREHHAVLLTSLPEDDFEYLRERHPPVPCPRIVLEQGKEYPVLSRLEPVARDHSARPPSPSSSTRLRSRELTSALHYQVVDALTTSHTLSFSTSTRGSRCGRSCSPRSSNARSAHAPSRSGRPGALRGAEPFSLAICPRSGSTSPDLAAVDLRDRHLPVGARPCADRPLRSARGEPRVAWRIPSSRGASRGRVEWEIETTVRFEQHNLQRRVAEHAARRPRVHAQRDDLFRRGGEMPGAREDARQLSPPATCRRPRRRTYRVTTISPVGGPHGSRPYVQTPSAGRTGGAPWSSARTHLVRS